MRRAPRRVKIAARQYVPVAQFISWDHLKTAIERQIDALRTEAPVADLSSFRMTVDADDLNLGDLEIRTSVEKEVND